jgi:2-dehydro-3-deoxyphosphogalactonate aldolase
MQPTRSTVSTANMAPTFAAGAWPTALPLVAILRGIEPHEAAAHATALLEAGFDCIEVPTNSPSWADSVRTIAELAAGRALVGAGTVLTAAHLDALVAAGGRMAVSPHTDTDLVAEATGRGLFVLPGAMTASEVFAAQRAGAHAVKLFRRHSSERATSRRCAPCCRRRFRCSRWAA